MIVLIKYDRKIVSFNNYTTTFNLDILKFKDSFERLDLSTFLIYRKNSPENIKTNKRNFKSLGEINIDFIKEKCILFFHCDIIDSSNTQSICDFIKKCENQKKIVVIQFSESTEHLFDCEQFRDIIKIDSKNLDHEIVKIEREIKLSKLIN